jgi:aminoglycoside phosphotransferase family enzyme/predicted kinase
MPRNTPTIEGHLDAEGAVGAGEDQRAIIAFLMQPESYPESPPEVSRIDTHGAAIFLAGERAYKLKRAVKLAYLDFSTPEKRKAMCERELALNRPLAPRLYRGLVPVTREAGGALRLGGAGEPADWLIEMERFADAQLFDRLAVAGRLDGALIEKLAEVIERFHAAAPVCNEPGWPAGLGQIVRNVARALSGVDETATAGGGMPGYLTALQVTLDGHRDLLTARREAGLVRRCHGDLHLKNIVLIDAEPCLFDALEFDEDLARIDVLYDLAFLVMDLAHRGLKSEAHALLNHYFSRDAADIEWRGLALFPFFLALRAAIRAMVGLDGLSLAQGEKRAALAADINAYAELAKALLSPPAPMLIAVGGLSGTGKSTLARAIAPSIGAAPGAIILRSDVERKLRRGAGVAERLGAQAYAPEARNAVYSRLLHKAQAILQTGHCVILDAVFREPRQRERPQALAERLGVPFLGIWLEAPKGHMLARVAARRGDASDADAGVVLRQLDSTVPPSDWRKVDASGSKDETAAEVRALIQAFRFASHRPGRA